MKKALILLLLINSTTVLSNDLLTQCVVTSPDNISEEYLLGGMVGGFCFHLDLKKAENDYIQDEVNLIDNTFGHYRNLDRARYLRIARKDRQFFEYLSPEEQFYAGVFYKADKDGHFDISANHYGYSISCKSLEP